MKSTIKAKAKTAGKKRGPVRKQKHLVEDFAQDLKEAFAKGYANAVNEVLATLQKLSKMAGTALGKKTAKKSTGKVKAGAKTRGRPRKNKAAAVDTTTKKRRGRPPKSKA